MKFLIIDKQSMESILADSHILDVAHHGKVSIHFVEHQGEDLIFMTPRAGFDSFMVGSATTDDLSGHAPGYNIHAHLRQGAMMVAALQTGGHHG
jgi:hypothetical protein